MFLVLYHVKLFALVLSSVYNVYSKDFSPCHIPNSEANDNTLVLALSSLLSGEYHIQ